jgi:hypothetical protein
VEPHLTNAESIASADRLHGNANAINR